MTALSDFDVPTFTGQLVDLTDPRPELITREAIAHQLAQITCWNGASHTHYSVAQHALMVSNTVRQPRAKIYALLNRASEYLMGPIPAPTRNVLERQLPGAANVLRDLRNKLDEAIWQHFELAIPDEAIIADVAQAERQVEGTEWRDCLPTQNCRSPYVGMRLLSTAIPSQPPGYIECIFLDRLDQLLALEHYRKQQAAE